VTVNTGDGPPVFALLGAGGTGGHTYPALALARELVARGHPVESVRFVGGNRGFEARVVPEAGFAIDLLPLGRGLRRSFTLENVGIVAGAARAAWDAHRLVRRYRPRVVIGFGSYVSFPCVIAARLSRIPTLIHEQDAAPGLANRLSVRLGARAATSLPDTPLRGARLVGNPIRPEFMDLLRSPSAPPLLAIVGGSLGAGTLNNAGLALADAWRDLDSVAVHHVAGPRNFEECERRLAALRRPGDRLQYTLVPYEDHLDRLYARCSLALCRAGAGTVAELTASGVPSVLVPLPGAPSDHQTHNARTLEARGAAVVVADAECDTARLDPLLRGLLTDADRLAAMGRAARDLARSDAAQRLADFVEECARG
jgi:UDP-N-acetylglucosamine--N-acetylmuramyl-(pentapeptide) pyrophosphoryl-undecaprenol N-acetylglucosamine transferase